MKRQTPLAGWPTFWAASPLDVNPFHFPVRYNLPLSGLKGRIFGGVDEIVLGRKSVFVRRKILGMVVSRKRVSLSEFQGVGICVGVQAHGDADEQYRVLIGLRHEDPQLCIPLYQSDDIDVAGPRWDAFGRSLGLALMSRDESGEWAYPFKQALPLGVYKPIGRSAQRILASRRPLMMKFRKSGAAHSQKRVSGAEIIAPH